MKSSWDTHVELERQIKRQKKRQEWLKRHGPTVRKLVYFGIGIFLALILAAIVAF